MKIGDLDVQLQNTVYQTTPLVIHGNGPTKVLLNSLGNYLAKSWTQDDGCLACAEDQKDISTLNVSFILLYCIVLLFQKVLVYSMFKSGNLDTSENLFLYSFGQQNNENLRLTL